MTSSPASVPFDGNLKVMWVEAIADTANPTAAECNAGTSLDLSCSLTGDGFNPNVTEQTIDDPRLCQRQDFERPGRFKHELEVAYTVNPTSGANNQASLNLTYLTEGFIVVRYGTDFETTFAAGNIVDVYPVQCGKQRRVPGTANGVIKRMQKLFVTGEVQEDVLVA